MSEGSAPRKPEKRMCRYPKCERVIVWKPTKFVWVHASPGADHAPIP